MNTTALSNNREGARSFRMTPMLEVPSTTETMQGLISIDNNQWDKNRDYGYQDNAIINGVEWDHLRNTIVWSKKQIETGIISTIAVSNKHWDYSREFGSDRMIIINDKLVLKDKRLKSADINEDGQMVYTLGDAIFMKHIYDDNHRIIPANPEIKMSTEEYKIKSEREKQEFEQAPKYPSILQGPFITSSWHVVIVGTKKDDEGIHLYIDHREIPLDIHKLSAPLKVEGDNLFISFKTPVGTDRITKIELDNHRERPKKGHYLVEGYRALTQQQVKKITNLTEEHDVLTAQRDDLVKLHDEKITKLTDKDAEIAQLLKLLNQEKEKTDALSERVDRLENTIIQKEALYEKDLFEMKLAHGGIVTVITESLSDLWKAIEAPWAFWGKLKDQAIIASDRIRNATAQIRHIK